MIELKKGFEQLNLAHYEQALRHADSVIHSNPLLIDAYVLKGLAFINLKKYKQASVCLLIAHKQQRTNEFIFIHLMDSLINSNQYEQALKWIKGVEINSEQVSICKIKVYEINGLYNQAINETAYLKSKENELLKLKTIALNNEHLNKDNIALKYAKKIRKIESNNFIANWILAKLYLKDNKLSKASKCINRIDKSKLNKTNLSLYYSVKAVLSEKRKKFNKAFKHYTKSNKALKKTNQFKSIEKNGMYGLETIDVLSKLEIQTNENIKIANNQSPIFMVGFPRSGTTLLDQMIGTHSEIEVIEEKPIINNILKKLLHITNNFKEINQLSSNEIQSLQQQYVNDLLSYSSDKKPIKINKMPLNMIYIGILYKIFPNAKFIISTRDYRDVALSCYFQSFALNEAMVNFLDWKLTNKYLSKAMQLCNKLIKELPIQYQRVKYEELIENPFDEVKKVLTFIGLKWQKEIKNYRTTIIGKNINTPSYKEVVRKIHKQRKGRWHNYFDQIKYVDHYWEVENSRLQ